MRRKRNKINPVVSTDGYIKRYFGNDISKILVPSNRFLQNCEIPYVSHPEAENELSQYLIMDSEMDKLQIFTGLTGSGKSTIVRHVFVLEKNSINPHISGNTIIIPVDFNRAQKSANTAILSSLRASVAIICDLFKIDYPDDNNEKFYKYIRDIRYSLTTIDPKSGPATPYAEKMKTLREQMETTYASCQLQYVMDKPECKLDLVILIVDNIEAFRSQVSRGDKSKYLSPVIEAFELAECINQRRKPTKWSFNMVIACRHHIWRIMKGEFSDNVPENALLQSYIATGLPYDLANPVRIDEIVSKRNEVLARKQSDPAKWKQATYVVNTLLQTMENGIGDFVLQLELKDLRKSMSKMQELIFHKDLQRESDDKIASGAFQIDSVEQFDLTRVNLIKTIGIGNRKYYAESCSVIPNLLYNEQNAGIELYPLLTLKYFLIKCGYAEPAWDNPVSIPVFYEDMRAVFDCFDNGIDKFFVRSVQYLIQHRLLLRSADQPQDEVPGLSLEETKKIEQVYVSGSAVKIWEELSKSSALFQLFLDDIWLEESSEYFTDSGNDIEHCVTYLKNLFKIEKRIFNIAKNISYKRAERYVEHFGAESLCTQLGSGLISSLDTIISSGDSRAQGRVGIARKTLNDANELREIFVTWESTRV